MTCVLNALSRAEKTLKKPVSFSGIGIHTGEVVTLRFVPAEPGSGILFKRVDLPGAPIVPATLAHVCDTSRCTTIGRGDVRIHTVEHVLAALRAFQIDNVVCEISNIEPPVAEGNSKAFVEMIKTAEVVPQQAEAKIVKLLNPVYWSEGGITIVAIPYDGYRISYTLNYPKSPILQCQYFTAEVTSETFEKEISPCRTFSLYEEVSVLMDAGLIKGGSLDNAVIIKDDVIFSKEGLHFPNEMVRHKVLDMIGDMALIGVDFHAHLIAIRAGHASNFAFAKKLKQELS